MSDAIDLVTPTVRHYGRRRLTHPKRSSVTPHLRPGSSDGIADMPSSGSTSNLGGEVTRRKHKVTQSLANPHPWMDPLELRYIDDIDFPQNILIQYLCSKIFSIPPREPNTNIQLFNVTTLQGTIIGLPRGYRVPLMFVAKFQWDSLKLVLTAADPQKEWDEYKFDIIHLCRLCERLFFQAEEAQKGAVAAGSKGIDRLWRSPTFDRVLTRFFHRWFVSREWSIRKFWEEFDDEEYDNDVLKHDWTRWALRGHKGFTLTKDEIQEGITTQGFVEGLSRNPQGSWIWNESPSHSTINLQSLIATSSSQVPAIHESNPNGPTMAQLENLFTEKVAFAAPSHNTIEIKKERIELGHEDLASSDKTACSASLPSIPEHMRVVTNPVAIVDSKNKPSPNKAAKTDTNSQGHGLGAVPTSPVTGQKRSRTPISSHEAENVTKRIKRQGPVRYETFLNLLDEMDPLVKRNLLGSSDSDSDSDSNDPDYRAPRKNKARARKKSAKSGSTSRLDHASKTSMNIKKPATSGLQDRPSKRASNPSTDFKSTGKEKREKLNTTLRLLNVVQHSTPVKESDPKSCPTVMPTAVSEPKNTTSAAPPGVSLDAGALSVPQTHEIAPLPPAAEIVSPLVMLPDQPPSHGDIPMLVDAVAQANGDPEIPCPTALGQLEPSVVPRGVSENDTENLLKEPDPKSCHTVMPTAIPEPKGTMSAAPPGVSLDAGALSVPQTHEIAPLPSAAEIVLPLVTSPYQPPSHGDIPMLIDAVAQANGDPEISCPTPVGQLEPSVAPRGVSENVTEKLPEQDVAEETIVEENLSDLDPPFQTEANGCATLDIVTAAVVVSGKTVNLQATFDHINSSVDEELNPTKITREKVQSTQPVSILPVLNDVEMDWDEGILDSIMLDQTNLRERLVELDKLSQLGPEPACEAVNRLPGHVNKGVATANDVGPSLLLTQKDDERSGPVENPEPITLDKHSTPSLTPDATIVDLSSVPETMAPTGSVAGFMSPRTRLVASLIRNLADLLDCMHDGDTDDMKGKKRALEDSTVGIPSNMALINPLLNEFKYMPEEMRKSQQKGKEEIDLVARLHRVELTSLHERIRVAEDKYQRELEQLMQRHREEMDLLLSSVREEEEKRETKNEEADRRLPSLEILELRRRITALEGDTRSPSRSCSCVPRFGEDERMRTAIHPLDHLFHYDDRPISSQPFDGIPLPIKSQRKFHRMSMS